MGSAPQVARGSKSPLALLPKAVDLRSSFLQTRLEGGQEPGELACVQAGERPQELGLAQSGFDIHALCLRNR